MSDVASSGVYKMPGGTNNLREARLGVTTVVAVISTAVGMGVTWGAYSNRLAEVERKASDAEKSRVAACHSNYTICRNTAPFRSH